MMKAWIRNALLVFVLAGAGLAFGCGASNPDGKYRAPDGSVTLELNGRKASINVVQIHIDGTYKVDGNKLVISPTEGDTSQTIAFVINKDGSLEPPQGSQFPRLEKVK